MTPVVISYYPGSGGNRLAWHLLNFDWQAQPELAIHTGSHLMPTAINYGDRDIRPYPSFNTRIVNRSSLVELTHCVNSALLRRHFPGRRIIKIKSNLASSLSRYWQVFGQALHEQEIRKINSFYALDKAIQWHWNYYQQTGVDWEADQVYDLGQNSDEFSVFMRENIEQNRSQEFDDFAFTWQKFKKRSLNF
jgi:hypothetical protein